MNYRYILYGRYGFYSAAYSDINEMSGAALYMPRVEPVGRSWIIHVLYRMCYSAKLNNIVELPFKKLFYRTFIPKDYRHEDKICFLFFSRWMAHSIWKGYLSYLKSHFPNSKFVCYYQDIMATHKNVDLDWVRDNFDVVLTYDVKDAEEYGIEYYPTPFSFIDVEENPRYYSDVYFLGTAKNRLPKILNIYDRLSSRGYNCLFFIAGEVDDLVKQKYPQIKFINQMSYEENLNYVRNTKCIVEVMQEGAIGITPRVWESIMYDKYLISDNSYLRSTRYYSEYMCVGDLDPVDFLCRMNQMPSYPKDLKSSMSPVCLVNYLDKKLS